LILFIYLMTTHKNSFFNVCMEITFRNTNVSMHTLQKAWMIWLWLCTFVLKEEQKKSKSIIILSITCACCCIKSIIILSITCACCCIIDVSITIAPSLQPMWVCTNNWKNGHTSIIRNWMPNGLEERKW